MNTFNGYNYCYRCLGGRRNERDEYEKTKGYYYHGAIDQATLLIVALHITYALSGDSRNSRRNLFETKTCKAMVIKNDNGDTRGFPRPCSFRNDISRAP